LTLQLISCFLVFLLYREHLKKLYRPEYIPKTVAIIALNCEEPWNAIKSLRSWIEVLMDILEEHMKGLPLETQDKLRTQSIFRTI